MSEALSMIRAAGFRLELEGGELFIEPFSKLTPDQKAFLTSHRDEMLDALRREQAGESGPAIEEALGLNHCRECQKLINGRCFAQGFRPVDDIPRRCADFVDQRH
jgi:hypothetical protein